MNYLFLRKLSTQLSLNYLKQSLISYKTIRRLYICNNHVLRVQNKCLSLNKWQPINRSVSTSQEINLFVNKLNNNFVDQKRYKKGKKGPKRETKDESDEESDAEEEQLDEFDPDLIDGKSIGFNDVNTTLVSLRLDNVLKAGLTMARTKADEAFYANLIRVNGQRVSKKSAELAEDDEIDLIKGINQDNSSLIDVKRVVIKKVEDKLSSKERIRVKLRKFPNLTIENYPNDPYDGPTVNITRRVETEKID